MQCKGISSGALRLLQEALRRYTMRHPGQRSGGDGLTEAWTGLGSATTYKPAVKAGLMECATSPNPGYMTWWRLTAAGAEIVQRWLDEGWSSDGSGKEPTCS